MRNLAPPSAVTDPFPAQWLRSIQSAGHPVFDSLLGGTWRDVYISDGWKISSDGIIRQGGHRIEFGIKVGKSIRPLLELPCMVQHSWPKVSIRILGKSTPDRVIRLIPALFTNSVTAGSLAIEIDGMAGDIAIRTQGLYSTHEFIPATKGWSLIRPSSKSQRIVFSRTKPTSLMARQLTHASSCVSCLNDSDIPTWLTTAMAPALQYSATRPLWIQALLGFPISQPDTNTIALMQCRTELASGSEASILEFFNTLDARQPKIQPELGLVMKWVIANHPASKLKSEVEGSRLAVSAVGSTPFARALAYAVTRIPFTDSAAASALTKDVRAGRLSIDAGMAAAIFASSGDSDLATGAASLISPSAERTQSLITPSEWLAMLYASPIGFGISGCLSIDKNPSIPFGVRSPILSSAFAGVVTSRKDIEANRVRLSVVSGSVSVRSLRTWRTETASASALSLHLGRGGKSTTVNANVDINHATTITFPRSVQIAPGESLVISTVGTT